MFEKGLARTVHILITVYVGSETLHLGKRRVRGYLMRLLLKLRTYHSSIFIRIFRLTFF